MTTHSDTCVLEIMEQAIGAPNVSESVAGYSIDGLAPKAVIIPRSVDELAQAMAAANKERLAVAPWGGGTRMTLGNPIKRLDVIADLTNLNRVVQHNAADLTVVTEAGITMSNLRETLAQQGQFLALDPALPERATIGGTLAAGVSGPLKWHFGSSRDLVIGMKTIQADGRLTKSGGQVVKNVSGYDMSRLHVGSLGTLGIIVEVSFKLTPIPRQESTILATFDSAESCFNAALGIFNSHVMPLAMTAFSRNVSQSVDIDFSLISDATYSLAIGLGGRPMTLQRMVNETLSICREAQATAVEKLEWKDTRDVWGMLTDFGWDTATEAFLSARIAVLPKDISSVAKVLQESGAAVVSHPGYGMMNAHWFAEDEMSVDAAREILTSAHHAVHEVGGNMIVERYPLEVKAHIDVWDEVGEPIETMRRMKEQYDPNGILNPGRFVGGI